MAKYNRISITLTEAKQAKLLALIKAIAASRLKGQGRLRYSPFWVIGQPVYFSGPDHLLAQVQSA